NTDVNVTGQQYLMKRYRGCGQADVDEIESNIAPFFGNSIFSHDYPWHEDYPYLSLYEAFGKLAAVLQETERYEAFSTLHKTFRSNVSNVVPGGTKPAEAIMWAGSDQTDSTWPYVISGGTGIKAWREPEDAAAA